MTRHLSRITQQAWEALAAGNDPPYLFRHAGAPARLERDAEGHPFAVTLTEDRLVHESSTTATWFKQKRSKPELPPVTVHALPPVRVIRNMLATPFADQPLPILTAITAAPSFAADGSLHVSPGYHPAGRTYFAPTKGFVVPPVPPRPTAAEIACARMLLCDELLGDFPFTGPAELAHAVGVMLLSFGRSLIDGPTPLHLLEKPSPGTGATLLADVLLYPATGRTLAALTEGRDEEEWRKRLTAVLRTSPPAIMIDNLKERLDTAALAAILTTSKHEDRILGTSDIVRIPVRAVWLASGNNPTLSNEITRRTVRIRLDAHQERPWLRQGFRQPRLQEWVREQRPRLCQAALTLIMAWLAEGKPRAEDAPRLGMYENWSRVIGGILDHTQPGPPGSSAGRVKHNCYLATLFRTATPPAKECPMRLSVLFPHLRGLRLVRHCATVSHLTLVVAPTSRTARCPCCRRVTRQVHSRFERRIMDLPCGGRAVALVLQARRFSCRNAACPKRTCRERLPGVVAPRVRGSDGLRSALTRVGMALGGEPGARLARQLSMPTSGDTVLRLVCAAPLPAYAAPRVLGIDDWSWRRGRTFGTILVDLEAHRPVDLLADRAPDTVAAWLAAHPGTAIVARDRSEGYAEGARRGAPAAIHVADRWHLLDNLGAALERFLLNKQVALQAAAASVAAAHAAHAEEDESLPPPRQPWQLRQDAEGERRHAKRLAHDAAIHSLRHHGADIAAIARTVGVSRETVYRYLRLDDPPSRPRPRRPPRVQVLAPYEAYVRQRWEEGCHNAMRLWREIRAQGFGHSYTPVARRTARLRQGHASTPRSRTGLASVGGPTVRQVARLFLRRPDDRTDPQQAYLDAVCQADATIATAYAVAHAFGQMLRGRHGERLEAWVEAASGSGIAALRGFAIGLRADYAAVKAGLTLEWSNGQTEGQINRLKLLKRQMYGRAGFTLLRQRVLHRS